MEATTHPIKASRKETRFGNARLTRREWERAPHSAIRRANSSTATAMPRLVLAAACLLSVAAVVPAAASSSSGNASRVVARWDAEHQVEVVVGARRNTTIAVKDSSLAIYGDVTHVESLPDVSYM